MARSSSYDFIYTRDNIINHAFRLIGVLGEDQTASTNRLTQGGQALNLMIKLWQGEGIGLWLNKEVIVMPQADTVQYYLGPASDSTYGTYATLKDDFVKTECATAAVATATTIVVDSATGMTTGYSIGIETDNEDIHWATLTGIAGTTLTFGTALDYGVAVDRHIYFSTDWSIERPMELIEGFVRDMTTSTSTDVPLEIFSLQEYRSLATKTNESKPTSVAMDFQLDFARAYFWPEPNNMKQLLHLILKFPVQDFDSSSDNPDFPVEWSEALTYNLAVRLAAEYGRTPSPIIVALAQQSYETLKGFDREQVSVRFKPRTRDYRPRIK